VDSLPVIESTPEALQEVCRRLGHAHSLTGVGGVMRTVLLEWEVSGFFRHGPHVTKAEVYCKRDKPPWRVSPIRGEKDEILLLVFSTIKKLELLLPLISLCWFLSPAIA
jgi:hypothetical protein